MGIVIWTRHTLCPSVFQVHEAEVSADALGNALLCQGLDWD